MLSNNKVCAKLLHIDEDGRRSTKITYSECITVFFGSTNSDFSCMSTAMRRRWHLGHFDERFGVNRAIIELELMSLILNDSEKSFRTKLNREHHLLQALVFEVEKLIHCRGLTNVSMHVAMVIILYLSNEMHVNNMPEPNPSMFTRVLILARINCILDAIDNTFFTKGAKFAGKPIEVWMLKHLDRKLYCTAQHVVSALGETIELMIDPSELIVRRCLKYMHQNGDNGSRPYRQLRQFVDGPDNAAQRIIDTGTDNSNDYIAAVINNAPAISASTNFGVKGNNKHAVRTPPVCKPDYNYIAFPKKMDKCSLKVLATRISSVADNLDPRPPYRPSSDVVHDILIAWKQRKIDSYNWAETTPGFPPEEIIDERVKPGSHHLIIDNEQRYHVHTKFIMSCDDSHTPKDFIQNVIVDLFSRKHQLPQSFCFTPNECDPHIRDMIHVPGEINNKMITIPSVVRVTSIERSMLSGVGDYGDINRTYKNYFVDYDLDTWGLMRRNETLYINTQRVDPDILKQNPLMEIGKPAFKEILEQMKNQTKEPKKPAKPNTHSDDEEDMQNGLQDNRYTNQTNTSPSMDIDSYEREQVNADASDDEQNNVREAASETEQNSVDDTTNKHV